MRELFKAYIPRDDEAFSNLWKASEFTFDANVLLDLYSASEELRQSFVEQLTAVKDRIFLTHQAALEFYRNRREVRARALRALDSITDSLLAIPAAVSEGSAKQLTEILASEKNNIKEFLRNDPVEKALADLFENKVGQPYGNLQSKYNEIDQRYANRIPPGYADEKDKDDYKKYGDAILWLQVIDHAKSTKRPAILVTAEKKGDWWLKGSDGKIVGPRPELEEEIAEKAHVEFYLYSFKQFMQFAPAQLKTSPTQQPEETAKEIDKLERQHEKVQAFLGTLKKYRDQWSTYMPGIDPPAEPEFYSGYQYLEAAPSAQFYQPVLHYMDTAQRDRRIAEALRTLELYTTGAARSWAPGGIIVQNALKTLREELEGDRQWPQYVMSGMSGLDPVTDEARDARVVQKKVSPDSPVAKPNEDTSPDSTQTDHDKQDPLKDELPKKKTVDDD